MVSIACSRCIRQVTSEVFFMIINDFMNMREAQMSATDLGCDVIFMIDGSSFVSMNFFFWLSSMRYATSTAATPYRVVTSARMRK